MYFVCTLFAFGYCVYNLPISHTFKLFVFDVGLLGCMLDLPAEAIKYVRRVEELIDCPVAMLSTSPERDDTILVTDPFAD